MVQCAHTCVCVGGGGGSWKSLSIHVCNYMYMYMYRCIYMFLDEGLAKCTCIFTLVWHISLIYVVIQPTGHACISIPPLSQACI